MAKKPKKISASRSEGILKITWDGGETSEYSFRGLRAACPCAECRGGHENMGGPGDPEMMTIPIQVSEKVELDHIEPVGNYAIQLHWKDGHSFGIYTWQYLWELNPIEDGQEMDRGSSAE
jgi:DUF971 family protein